jgi:hypothetical protein
LKPQCGNSLRCQSSYMDMKRPRSLASCPLPRTRFLNVAGKVLNTSCRPFSLPRRCLSACTDEKVPNSHMRAKLFTRSLRSLRHGENAFKRPECGPSVWVSCVSWRSVVQSRLTAAAPHPPRSPAAAAAGAPASVPAPCSLSPGGLLARTYSTQSPLSLPPANRQPSFRCCRSTVTPAQDSQ